MSAKTKILYRCKCGSFNINQDANYRVNDDEYSTYDAMSCEGCGYDGLHFNEYKVPADFDYKTQQLPGSTS